MITFDILSKKKNKLNSIIHLSILILLLILVVLNFRSDIFFIKVILFVLCLYMLSPWSIIRNKTIGKLELNDNYISFVTQTTEDIKLSLADISFCQLRYSGFKNNMVLMARGWSWDSGVCTLRIETKEEKYEILFLSQSVDDNDKLIKYIDVLKKNNISYRFDMKSLIFDSSKKNS